MVPAPQESTPPLVIPTTVRCARQGSSLELVPLSASPVPQASTMQRLALAPVLSVPLALFRPRDRPRVLRVPQASTVVMCPHVPPALLARTRSLLPTSAPSAILAPSVQQWQRAAPSAHPVPTRPSALVASAVPQENTQQRMELSHATPPLLVTSLPRNPTGILPVL